MNWLLCDCFGSRPPISEDTVPRLQQNSKWQDSRQQQPFTGKGPDVLVMNMSKPSVPRLVSTTAAMFQNLAINEISLHRDDLSDSERQQLTASLQQETLNIQHKQGG